MSLVCSNAEERNRAVAVPGYRLLDKAGEGGMGAVFRAMQLSLNRVVAVKILHTTTGCGDSLPAFHRESRLLASLSHPHIVTIHDCGHHDGRYFLVTKFVSGSPLRAAMKPGKPWPIDRLVKHNSSRQAKTLGLYQWLARTPDRPGEIVVFRFRARAERGEGRLLLGPRLPLVIPRDERGADAERLRALSAPHAYLSPRGGVEMREYRPLDWVQPGASWQTYAIIWDWPEFATEVGHRNIEILLGGLGEIWVDDIEMFTWGQELTRDKEKRE